MTQPIAEPALLPLEGEVGRVLAVVAHPLGPEPPHVPGALVAVSLQATHGLDVTGNVDRAVRSLAAHTAYLEGLGDHPMADPEILRMFLGSGGQRFRGEGAAVLFELF